MTTNVNNLPKAVINEPSLPAYKSDADAKRRAADLRALSLQRTMAYGLEFGDALLLRALVEQGADWTEAGESLAERALAIIDEPVAPVTAATRRISLQRAAGCLRIAQIVLPRDDERRVAIMRRATDLFAESVQDDPRYTRLEIPHPAGTLYGWWIRGGDRPRRTVLVIGGMEGWADDHHEAASALLARGLDAVLIDGPGQGMTRIVSGHYLSPDFVSAYHAVVDHLVDDRGLDVPIGVWGNSMGGNFAMHLAAVDDRITACVNNGGGAILRKLGVRPASWAKMKQMCGPMGTVDDEQADAVFASTVLDESNLTLTCPVLVMHAGQDQLVERDDMTILYEGARSGEKVMCTFEDAEHCVYRHPAEKYSVIVDWLVDRVH